MAADAVLVAPFKESKTIKVGMIPKDETAVQQRGAGGLSYVEAPDKPDMESFEGQGTRVFVKRKVVSLTFDTDGDFELWAAVLGDLGRAFVPPRGGLKGAHLGGRQRAKAIAHDALVAQVDENSNGFDDGGFDDDFDDDLRSGSASPARTRSSAQGTQRSFSAIVLPPAVWIPPGVVFSSQRFFFFAPSSISPLPAPPARFSPTTAASEDSPPLPPPSSWGHTGAVLALRNPALRSSSAGSPPWPIRHDSSHRPVRADRKR